MKCACVEVGNLAHAQTVMLQRSSATGNMFKKVVDTSTEYSQQSSISLSLPTTQTHTVLSYCENDSATANSGVEQNTSNPRFAFRKGRNYEYCMHSYPRKKPNPKVRCQKKTTATKLSKSKVYEYSLTPQMQVTCNRTREQAS